MRLNLAKKLSKKADLLILDEPTNHLDMLAVDWLIEYLLGLKTTLIIISHDKYFLDKLASSCLFLQDNEAKVYKGNYTVALALKKDEEAFKIKELEKMAKILTKEQEITQKLLSHRKMTSYHSREKRVSKLEDKIKNLKNQLYQTENKLKISILKEENLANKKTIVIDAKDISLSFDDKKILNKASLCVRAFDKIALLGANGSGKTTFLKILTGELLPDDGKISMKQDLVFAYMSQNISFPDENLTLLDVMLENDISKEEALSRLAKFSFGVDEASKKISSLSGGERSLLFLALLLIEKPDLIFLDEPTNHLDLQAKEVLKTALIDYEGAIITVSHDRDFISAFSRRFISVEKGELIEYDEMDKLIKRQRILYEEKEKSYSSNAASKEKQKSQPSNSYNKFERRKKLASLNDNIRKFENEISNINEKIKDMEIKIEAELANNKYMDANFYKEMSDLSSKKYELEEKLIEALIEIENFKLGS